MFDIFGIHRAAFGGPKSRSLNDLYYFLSTRGVPRGCLEAPPRQSLLRVSSDFPSENNGLGSPIICAGCNIYVEGKLNPVGAIRDISFDSGTSNNNKDINLCNTDITLQGVKVFTSKFIPKETYESLCGYSNSAILG